MSLWGLHAGHYGDADRLFFAENCIALGWTNIPDLSKYVGSPAVLKEAIARFYKATRTEDSKTPIPQMFNFILELQTGDVVVFSSFKDGRLHFARVVGDYYYDYRIEPKYRHRRKVVWDTHSVPREDMSERALRMGVDRPQSLFRIKDQAAQKEYLLKMRRVP